MVELARGGDRPAHDRLTLGYWWLARTIARPFATASVPSDEFAVQALIGTPNGKDKITNGLAYAIKKYKRNEKRGFRNHAAEAMRWAIQEFLRQNPTRKSLSEERYKDDVSGRPITWLESVVDETPDYVAEVKWRLGLAILDSLEPIAKRIFIARHCFEDKRPTLHQLARQFDCSHEGVRRILLKAESFVRQRCEKSRVEN